MEQNTFSQYSGSFEKPISLHPIHCPENSFKKARCKSSGVIECLRKVKRLDYHTCSQYKIINKK